GELAVADEDVVAAPQAAGGDEAAAPPVVLRHEVVRRDETAEPGEWILSVDPGDLSGGRVRLIAVNDLGVVAGLREDDDRHARVEPADELGERDPFVRVHVDPALAAVELHEVAHACGVEAGLAAQRVSDVSDVEDGLE